MSYPFPDIQNREFQWTFLKDVFFEFYLNENQTSPLDYGKANSFIREIFDSTLALDELETGVCFQNDDKTVTFKFKKEYTSLKMRFPAYRNFSDAAHLLPVIEEYISALGVSSFRNISITKYNELPYTVQKESSEIGEALKEIFSKDLRGDDFEEEAKTFSSLARWEKKCTITDSESATKFYAGYGFSTPTDRQDKGVVTLITTVVSNPMLLETDKLKAELGRLNKIIDRAFRWCVTDNIIDKMLGRNEEGV